MYCNWKTLIMFGFIFWVISYVTDLFYADPRSKVISEGKTKIHIVTRNSLVFNFYIYAHYYRRQNGVFHERAANNRVASSRRFQLVRHPVEHIHVPGDDRILFPVQVLQLVGVAKIPVGLSIIVSIRCLNQQNVLRLQT